MPWRSRMAWPRTGQVLLPPFAHNGGEHRLGLQLGELLDRVLHVLLGALAVLARLAELRDLPIDRLALRRLELHDHDEVHEAHRVGE